ncbi:MULTISPECIES: hypothetical protein [Microbacterium]|uniref:hypothetical protein n=1 Tax=Microbacterium TaxID=33882 RepID=UPI000D65A7AD|nr:MULTISPECIES: hypothetical protein [Microbacterium]
MSTPTDSPLDELRALRERAYGRDADIHDDPAALARLHELEALTAASKIDATGASPAGEAPVERAAGGARRSSIAAAAPSARPEPVAGDARPIGPAAGRRADAAPAALSDPRGLDGSSYGDPAAAAGGGGAPATASGDASPRVEEPGTAADKAGTEAEPEAPEPAKRWWRRRIPMLWAAVAVVGALFVGVGLTLAVQGLQAGRVAVLHQDPDGAWPDDFFGPRPAEGRVFEEFHGLSVLVFPQVMGPAGSQTCVYVVTDTNGFGTGNCGAGSFPPVANMVVAADAPEALLERFPEGTALQFVVDGEQVLIYAREPGIVQPTP